MRPPARHDVRHRAALRLAIVLGTVVALAFAAHASLGPLVTYGDRETSRFVVEVRADGAADGSGSAFSVQITPIVNGRALPLESVERTGRWRAGSVRDAINASTPDSVEPALLRFPGKDVVLVVAAGAGSGRVRLVRDDRLVGAVDVSTTAAGEGPLVIESPPAPASLALFVGALVVAAACAWWFGPIRADGPGTAWLLFFLSAFHLLFWASQCVGSTNDSPAYLTSFSRFVRGEPAYFPPGDPVFLGLIRAIAPESLGRWVILIQHGMVVIAALWVYLLLRRVVLPEVALLAGILTGILSPALALAQSVMSETATLFAMVGAVYFAVRSTESDRSWPALLAGVLAGWAGLLRVAPLAGLVPSLWAIQFLASSRPRALRRAGITVAATVAVVVTPMAWFAAKSGHLSLTDSPGFHLFNRVVNEQRLLNENGPATKTLLDVLDGQDPRGVNVWRINDQLERRGNPTEGQIEALLREVSLEAIRTNRWRFVLFTPLLAWRILFDNTLASWMTGWGETASVHPRLEIPPPLIFTAAGLTWRWTLEQIHSRV